MRIRNLALQFLVVLCVAANLPANTDTVAAARNAALAKGEAAFSRGDYNTALASFQTARDLTPNSGAGDAGEATVELNLATVFQALGKYPDAEILLTRAAAIDQRVFGNDSLESARAYSGFASLYADEGKYQQAAAMAGQALAIQQKADAGAAAGTLRTLGNIRIVAGEYREAKQFHERALELDRSRDPAFLALDQSLLARDAFKLGDLAGAERLFLQALPFYEAAPGSKQAEYAIAVNNFGQVEFALHHRKEAQAAYLKSLDLTRNALGPRHPNIASVLDNLGALYADERKYGKAEDLYRQALDMDEAALGKSAPQVARDLNNLGLVCLQTHRLDEAEAMLNRSLEISQGSGTAASVDAAIGGVNLANLYAARQDYANAERWFDKSVAVLQRAWGSRNPRLAAILDGYAAVLRADRKYAEAERLQVDATRVRVAVALNSDKNDRTVSCKN